MKLTQRRIDDLKCPADKRDILVFDEEQRGLGVRVTAGGGKTFLAQYSFAGAKRRIPLGACSAISLAAAREAVRAFLGDVAKGKDPASERDEARRKASQNSVALAELIDRWAKLHLSGLRPNYALAAESTLRRVFAQQSGRPASSLDRAAVIRALDGLTQDGKTAMASATARYGSAMFSWAVRRGAVSTNPFERVPLAPTTRRERVLSEDEIRRIWAATDGAGSFNAIVRMLLISGQRREEVAGMTWREVSLERSLWTIPAGRAKNGVAHLVPLPKPAHAILQTAPTLGNADQDDLALVFPGERGVFSGWSKSKDRLDRRSGTSDWTLHDLRRTVATGLQKLGIRLEVTEAVLNHVSGSRAGIVGVYQRHDYADEKNEALCKWSSYVSRIIDEGTTWSDDL